MQYQRVKVSYGADGSATDASDAAPLPVKNPRTSTTATITAANANLTTGVATAGSEVKVTVPEGHSAWTVFITGTWTAGTTLHFQGSSDGTNWHALNGRRNTASISNDVTTDLFADPVGGSGVLPWNFRGNLAGVRFFRVTCSPFAGGDTPAITLTTDAGVGAVFLNASLPAGNNSIGWVQIGRSRTETFRGRASSFATQGIATAATQPIISLYNATGSTVTIAVNRVMVDLLSIAAAGKAPTVQTPAIRIRKTTAIHTAGTVLTKQSLDTSQTSNASVTVHGNTASDGGALTTLAVTASTGSSLSQAWAPRILVVGTSASSFMDQNDRMVFFEGEPDIVVRPNEGVAVLLEGAVITTGNPATDRWLATVDWTEYTA